MDSAARAVAGTGEQRALVQTDADTNWIGGADGVFRRDDGAGDFAETAISTDVRRAERLRLARESATMYATAGADRRCTGGSTAPNPWTPISMNLPSGAGIAGHPLVLDGMVALLGTSAGVYRTLDGGRPGFRRIRAA